MQEKIDKAIENTLAMIRTNVKADEALKFSQSALNLAHAKQLLLEGKTTRSKGGSA